MGALVGTIAGVGELVGLARDQQGGARPAPAASPPQAPRATTSAPPPVAPRRPRGSVPPTE